MSNDWNCNVHIAFGSSNCNKTFSVQKENAPSLFSRMSVSVTSEVAWIEIHVARITRHKIRHKKEYNLNFISWRDKVPSNTFNFSTKKLQDWSPFLSNQIYPSCKDWQFNSYPVRSARFRVPNFQNSIVIYVTLSNLVQQSCLKP